MSLFKKKVAVKPVPEECKGFDIAVDSSTGERLIGFREPNSRKLYYPELVTSEKDIKDYYSKYGIPYTK